MYDELELDKLGDRKTALFLIMSDTDSTFNFLISMIYTQLFNLLCDKADDVYGGKLPIHMRCLIDECANIGQIPQLEKLVATIRSREISACLVLQTRSQLKAIYKDNADTIVGNMDSQIFLGGSEPTTLKDLAEALGKETIDSYNNSDTRGNSPSYGTNYQKLGHELMSRDELAVLDGGKCILQLRGVRPFLSDKYDLTQHPNYKYTSDYHEMCLNSSELIVPRDTYQRALHPARVARIAKEFDERVANEPKISFRDGHYYVMDGQNTIAARKFLNGGEDLQIRCKVYFGMTEREEALLFAQQTGISERLSAGQKLRALIFAGEPAAVAFQQATELAGVHLSFEEGRGKQRISCIATAYHEFIRLGPERYIESLDVLLNAWNDEPDSMSSANLLGICRFVELYHSEYNKGRLIAKLRQVDAFTIFRLARTAGVSLPGKTKYLQQVYTIYNGGSRRAALPLKF